MDLNCLKFGLSRWTHSTCFIAYAESNRIKNEWMNDEKIALEKRKQMFEQKV